MKHIPIVVGMAITCLLAAVANLLVARALDLNFFTLKIWFIVPAGAALVGMVGASGGILGARVFHVVPSWIDAAAMVIFAAVTMFLVYFLDYATFVLDDGRKLSDWMSFPDFVDLLLTKSHMLVGRGGHVDVGEVGRAGYWLAGVEFIGFLVGGIATFATLRQMDRCEDCAGAYLRKLKKRKSAELTYEEASGLLGSFKDGDLEVVRRVLAWTPPTRQLPKDSQRVVVEHELMGCPKCKTEMIVAKVKAFNGRQWADVDALTTKRRLANGFSLRQQFDP